MGYDQSEQAPPAVDNNPNGQGSDITGGYYGDMPPEVPNSNVADGTFSGQGAVSASSPAQLIFKNGSAYAVKAYWASGSELYYQPVYGGTNHVPLEQLDLAATVEANTRAGVPFTLSTQTPQK